MTTRKENLQKKANYYYLLDDADVKRRYDNVARGRVLTASIWLRRLGMVHKKFGKSPMDMAKMVPGHIEEGHGYEEGHGGGSSTDSFSECPAIRTLRLTG